MTLTFGETTGPKRLSRKFWDHLKKDKERYMFMAFDDNNDDIMAMIKEHAAKEVTTTGSRSL